MKKTKRHIVDFTSYFFTLLFVYASASKILDFENFQVQLAQSPLVSAYAGVLSYTIILVEISVAVLLSIRKSRLLGLYGAFGLMVAFSVYIFLILNYSEFVPCSCGGILENMGWTSHLIFNVFCVFVAGFALVWRPVGLTNGMKRRLFILTGLALCCSVCMVLLFLTSDHIIKEDNNFIRRFPQHPIAEVGSYNLKVNSYYFAGYDNGKLFLGNSTAPFLITSIKDILNDKRQMYIQAANVNGLFTAPKIKVKGSFYYLFDGTVPVIYRGLLGSSSGKSISENEAYFNEMLVLDSTRFAVRTIASYPKHFVLGLINTKLTPHFMLRDGLIDKKVQSLFESDGRLILDPISHQIIYIYSYRNKFEVMDSLLNHRNQFHTVDTTSVVKLKVKTLKNGNKRLLTPPPKVNKLAFAYNGVLFIESGIIGKYESNEAWKKASVIDMYDTTHQFYLGSFYIYRHGDEHLSDFLISGKSLFTIAGSSLTRYSLAPSITKYFQNGEAENLK